MGQILSEAISQDTVDNLSDWKKLAWTKGSSYLGSLTAFCSKVIIADASHFDIRKVFNAPSHDLLTTEILRYVWTGRQ